jgi:hypothetical protein
MKEISNIIYALLTVPMFLIIAIAIFNNFQTNVSREGWVLEANNTFSMITSGTWSGFNLASMLPFILIAVVIIGVILGAMILR